MEKVVKIISEAIIGTEFKNKVYLVGGYVRDKIMGNYSDDLDIVVELPTGGRRLAKFLHEKKLCSKPVIFDNFGTAFVLMNNHKIEFVMTRKEIYRDKDRKPDVAFGTLEEDIFRRDFTINSNVINVNSDKIIDISGKGIEDIENKIIRSTSDSEIIFSEDPLRMLRAVRFAVRFGFMIEENTKAGIMNNAEKLKHISWERRRDELTKMLESEKPCEAVQMLYEFGLMKNIVPELEKLKGLEQGKYHHLDAFEHTLLTLKNSQPDIVSRLAAFLHDISKPDLYKNKDGNIHFFGHEKLGAKMAEKILKRLKYSTIKINEVKLAINGHMRLKSFANDTSDFSDKALRKLIHQSRDKLESLLNLIHADNLSHHPDYCLPNQIPKLRERIMKLNEIEDLENMPVTGDDIMAKFGIRSGKKVGRILEKAQEIWFENPDLSSEEILEKL
jgi:poly(A) polymerase